MSVVDVTFPAPDGEGRGSLHLPEGQGPWPGVLMYPDAAGLRPTFRAMGDRMAGLGYATLVPDTYYRHGDWKPFDGATVFGDPEERTRLMGMARGLTAAQTVADAGAFLAFLAGRSDVADGPVGTTGYCMGGRASLLVAGHHPDRVGAAASFHGGRLADPADPEGPAEVADRVLATVYVAAAENDDSCPPEQLERLDKAYAEAGVAHTIETYPARHGFAVDDNPTYDEAAAERHWTAMETLFGNVLRG